MSITGKDLLGGPDPTLLPDETAPRELLEAGTDPAEVAAVHPTSSAAWAALADAAYARGAVVESYAYARTGYHRGLDALRRSGWKGYGPVPWSHAPNQGFLRALVALGWPPGTSARPTRHTGSTGSCRSATPRQPKRCGRSDFNSREARRLPAPANVRRRRASGYAAAVVTASPR